MQQNGVRFLVLLYSAFFLILAGMVLTEAARTAAWSSNVSGATVLLGVAALSGWFDKALGLLNLALGFGGGLLVRDGAEEGPIATVSRWALTAIVTILMVTTLVALWVVAEAYANITKTVAGFAAVSDLKVADAITTLGVLNLGIAGGFLAGLAIPGGAAQVVGAGAQPRDGAPKPPLGGES